MMTGFVMLTACKKDEQEFVPSNASNQQNAELKSSKPGLPANGYMNWQENFATSNSLDLRWNLYGTPQPQWVSFAFGRFGLFDNNGRLPNGSFAVSRTKIGNGKGYTIESDVYIDVTNPRGTTICPEIGVTRSLNLPTDPANNVEPGISMKLMYVGYGANSVPAVYQNNTYVVMTAILQDGTISSSSDPKDGMITAHGEYAFKADVAGNGWHKMKIVVTATKQVSFYLDGQFIWSPEKPIDASLLKDKNVLLGFTSSGNAGKAYHDYVKVTYLPILGPPADLNDPVSTE